MSIIFVSFSIIHYLYRKLQIMVLESEVAELTEKVKSAEEYASLKARRTFELEQDKRVNKK